MLRVLMIGTRRAMDALLSIMDILCIYLSYIGGRGMHGRDPVFDR